MTIELDLVLTMLEGGMSVQQIAEELDSTEQTVYSAIRRTYPGLIDKVKDERDEQIAEMYDLQEPPGSGNYVHSVTDVCAKYSISYPTMYKALAKVGVPRRRSPAHPLILERDARVVQDYEDGYPVQDLCLRNKVSQGTMYAILRRNKIQLRRSEWERSPALKTIGSGSDGSVLIGLFKPDAPSTPDSD